MQRTSGSKGLSLIECTNPRLTKYIVRWDMQEESQDDSLSDGEKKDGVTYYEHLFLHKPTLDEIKAVVFAQMNEDAETAIASGYTWQDKQVWLSQVNQLNYKSAYDLAVQTGGKSLPYKVKLGSNDAPEYVELKTLAEIEDFYLGALTFVNDTLSACWTAKDALDWSEYEKLLIATS